MKNIIWLTLNTLKIGLKKKIIAFVVLPLLTTLLVLGVYGQSNSGTLKLGIVDNDSSVISKDFIKSIQSEKKIKVILLEEKSIDEKITNGNVACVLVIPQGFESGIYSNNLKQPEVISIKGQEATAIINSYTTAYIRNLLDISEASEGSRAKFNKMYKNIKSDKVALRINNVVDESKSKVMTTQSVGFLIMFMMMGAGSLAELILKDKKNRTYFRILSSPVSSKAYVLSNVLSSFVIVVIQVICIILLMTKLLHINTYVSDSALFIILITFGLAAIGLGLAIVSFAKNSSHGNAITLLIVNPTCMLSGCFFPIEMMPKSMQRMADFLPQTWALGAIQKLQQSGDFSQIISNLGIILAFAVTFFIVAAYKFSRNDDVKVFL